MANQNGKGGVGQIILDQQMEEMQQKFELIIDEIERLW